MGLKAEYSYFRGEPSLVISGSEFLKFIDSEKEELLALAINGFAHEVGADSHFNDDVIEVVKAKIKKNSSYIITHRQDRLGHVWCEVYIQHGVEVVDIVISENGREFNLNRD